MSVVVIITQCNLCRYDLINIKQGPKSKSLLPRNSTATTHIDRKEGLFDAFLHAQYGVAHAIGICQQAFSRETRLRYEFFATLFGADAHQVHGNVLSAQ
jgi:hypothetical protein